VPRPSAGVLVFIFLASVACTDDVGDALGRTVEPPAVTVAASPEALPLTGTPWRLSTFAGGDVVFSVIDGTDVTMVFSADGTVSGSAGCNGYTGTYRSAGTTMAFSSLETTAERCGGPLMAQESAFLGAVRRVASASIEGTQLLLLDGHDDVLLSFDGSMG
jgi:heat shock protein HslJ